MAGRDGGRSGERSPPAGCGSASPRVTRPASTISSHPAACSRPPHWPATSLTPPGQGGPGGRTTPARAGDEPPSGHRIGRPRHRHRRWRSAEQLPRRRTRHRGGPLRPAARIPTVTGRMPLGMALSCLQPADDLNLVHLGRINGRFPDDDHDHCYEPGVDRRHRRERQQRKGDPLVAASVAAMRASRRRARPWSSWARRRRAGPRPSTMLRAQALHRQLSSPVRVWKRKRNSSASLRTAQSGAMSLP